MTGPFAGAVTVVVHRAVARTGVASAVVAAYVVTGAFIVAVVGPATVADRGQTRSPGGQRHCLGVRRRLAFMQPATPTGSRLPVPPASRQAAEAADR
jgi:hypothetical protein